MLPALAFLANPAFWGGAAKTAGAIGPLTGILGGSGKSSGTNTVVDVQQKVAQNQTVNIGTQSDLADQLAYLIGQAPIIEYPANTGGMLDNINSLYNQALGTNTPTASGLGDSRYSTLTGGVAPRKSNLNLYLIIGGIIIIAVLLIRKIRGH